MPRPKNKIKPKKLRETDAYDEVKLHLYHKVILYINRYALTLVRELIYFKKFDE